MRIKEKVRSFIKWAGCEAGFIKNYNYYKEVTSTEIKEKRNIELDDVLKNIE